jgi:hypothetical protein
MIFKHPSKVCMTYCDHCLLALMLSKEFFIGGVKSCIHAFIPDIFQTSASEHVNTIKHILETNGCR